MKQDRHISDSAADVMQIQDNALVRSIADGDEEALKSVIRNYGDLVFRTAFKIVCDESEAEDIAQEVFIRVWRKAASYDGRRPFASWIYRITCNLCIDFIRKRRITHPFSRLELSDAGGLPDRLLPAEISPEDRVILQETWSTFIAAASRLTPKQHITFVLKELEGLGTDEVSAITGMTPDRIKSNLYHARKAIREMMSRQF